jgi:hypothetical protein
MERPAERDRVIAALMAEVELLKTACGDGLVQLLDAARLRHFAERPEPAMGPSVAERQPVPGGPVEEHRAGYARPLLEKADLHEEDSEA